MNTPKTLSLPLRAEWRPIDSSYAIKDATGTVIAYARGGRSEEEALFLAHAANEYGQLAESLYKYGGHFRGSGPMCEALKHSAYPCTCGFDAALEKTKGVNHDV